MVKTLIEGEQKEFSMDGWLYDRINKKWLPTIKKDDDFVAVIDGPEGSGKSVFALQIGKVLDPNFNLDNICMNHFDFKKRIIEAKKGDCIVYDEAFTGLSSKGTMTEINKIIVELMMEMRQKNLKVLIVLPTYFMLEKYVALFRARCLFHVYRKNGRRGNWLFFGKKKKKLLYLLGKKFLSYAEPRSERKGMFPNFYTVNEQLYREKKASAFEKKDREAKNEKFKYYRDVLIHFMNKKLGIELKQIVQLGSYYDMGLDISNISKDVESVDTIMQGKSPNYFDDRFMETIIWRISKHNCLSKEYEQKDKALKSKLWLDKAYNRMMKEKSKLLVDINHEKSGIDQETVESQALADPFPENRPKFSDFSDDLS